MPLGWDLHIAQLLSPPRKDPVEAEKEAKAMILLGHGVRFTVALSHRGH